MWDGPGGPVTQAFWQCDPEQAPWGKGGPDLQLCEDVEQLLPGRLELGKEAVWARPARLLELEWPQAFPSHVHVPNSDPAEPHLERKEGACQKALLTANGESSGEVATEAADEVGGTKGEGAVAS